MATKPENTDELTISESQDGSAVVDLPENMIAGDDDTSGGPNIAGNHLKTRWRGRCRR